MQPASISNARIADETILTESHADVDGDIVHSQHDLHGGQECEPDAHAGKVDHQHTPV